MHYKQAAREYGNTPLHYRLFDIMIVEACDLKRNPLKIVPSSTALLFGINSIHTAVYSKTVVIYICISRYAIKIDTWTDTG